MRADRNADVKRIYEATHTGSKSEEYYWTDEAAS
jgi:hypothetical protein